MKATPTVNFPLRPQRVISHPKLSALIAIAMFSPIACIDFQQPLLVRICAWIMLTISVVALWMAFMRPELLVGQRDRMALLIGQAIGVSESGIETQGHLGTIPWSNITHVSVRSIGLVITVRDAESFIARLPESLRSEWHEDLMGPTPFWGLPGDLVCISQEKAETPIAEIFQTLVARLKNSTTSGLSK